MAADADPHSGYLVFKGGAWHAGIGGTSVVAPQLGGLLALVDAGVGGRVGLVNPVLYAAFKAQGHRPGSPFKAVLTGDNAYYKSTDAYNPATGLGAVDAAALATVLGVR